MISNLAYVDAHAQINSSVQIAPFAFIQAEVNIEENCWIGPNACVWEGANLSKNVRVFPGAQVSCEPQDKKYNGEKTKVFIGENTVIRENVTISKGTNATNKTIVGKNCLLMAYVHVAHDCVIGNDCIISNAVQIAGHVQIDDFVVIGGMSAIRQFVQIGKHAMITGGSLVRKDVPPYITVGREPLSYIGINAIGLKRRGYSQEKINEIQDIYRIVFLSELNTSVAIGKIEEEFKPTAERNEILNFIKNCSLGIIKGFE